MYERQNDVISNSTCLHHNEDCRHDRCKLQLHMTVDIHSETKLYIRVITVITDNICMYIEEMLGNSELRSRSIKNYNSVARMFCQCFHIHV